MHLVPTSADIPRFQRPVCIAASVVLALVLCGVASGAPPGSPLAWGNDTPRFNRGAGVWTLPRALPLPPAASGPAEACGEHALSPMPAGNRPATWVFSPNVRVHPDESGNHLWPDIARAADGTLGVAWMDDHAAGGYHIFYSSSTDDGVSWSGPERVDDRTAGTYSKFVSLAFTPGGTAVAVWEDDRSGQIQIYFSKRDPSGGGTPWTPNQRVNTAGGSPSGADFMNGSLAILDEQRYFVAWTDWREGAFYQVYGRGTWDGGHTWGAERRISDGLGYQPVAGDPCVIFDPASGPEPGEETLYCLTNDWRGYAPGGRYPNVYFYRSADGGATWSVGVRANDIEPYYQQGSSHALVCLDDGRLACGWLNNSDLTLHHFRVCLSPDSGVTWDASVQVDEVAPGGTGTYSSIASDGEALFAAFDIYQSDWDAYFRASPDGGTTWPDAMVQMDDNPGSEATGNPVLVATGPLAVHAAWQDGRAPGYNWKIYAAAGLSVGSGIEDGTSHFTLTWGVSPNPSCGNAAVRMTCEGVFHDRVGDAATLALYDAAGRRLRAWTLSGQPILWDGRDAHGHTVPAGCYWLRDSAGRERAGIPLIRVR